MKILITNDDGIGAHGLKVLHSFLKEHTDDITVVAPSGQCSCAAHSLTGEANIEVRRAERLFGDSPAYSVNGTPADCVRCALFNILEEKPDYVFAGINDGANVGQNILYSATVSAAMEALVHGIKAASFSIKYQADPMLVEETFMKVLDYIFKNPCASEEMYNVNFPGVKDHQITGINTGTHPSRHPYVFVNRYESHLSAEGSMILSPKREMPEETDEMTDVFCIENRTVSISRLKNIIL